MCGRPMRRWLDVSLLDLFGVTILSLFLGGIAWLFISAMVSGELSVKAGWLVIGLLFLIGLIWRYFIRAEITVDAACGHQPNPKQEPPGT